MQGVQACMSFCIPTFLPFCCFVFSQASFASLQCSCSVALFCAVLHLHLAFCTFASLHASSAYLHFYAVFVALHSCILFCICALLFCRFAFLHASFASLCCFCSVALLHALLHLCICALLIAILHSCMLLLSLHFLHWFCILAHSFASV